MEKAKRVRAAEKEKPKRKLPKKSKRPKRRYILFSLKQGSCNAKQAFDLVMGQFSPDQRKKFGVWFIQFKPETGFGIVRCRLDSERNVKNGIGAIGKQFEPKVVLVSGTLRKLRQKLP